MGLTDCRQCGHPTDPAEPQPCEAGGICSPLQDGEERAYVITDLGTDRQEVHRATMQRQSFLAVDPATRHDPDVMGFVIGHVDQDFASHQRVITVESVAPQEPPRIWADQVTTDQWRGYLEDGELP